VGGSNDTTTPRLNSDDTVRDAQKSTVQDTSTARVPDTKRNIPVANYDFTKASSHSIPRTGEDVKDLSNSEKLLKAITDDQGGSATPSKQKNSENLEAAAAAMPKKSAITSESITRDPIDHLIRSIGNNANRLDPKLRGQIQPPAEQDKMGESSFSDDSDSTIDESRNIENIDSINMLVFERIIEA
jgi:hypothetical protein